MIVIDQKAYHLTAGIDHGQAQLLIQKQITDAVAINLQRHQRTENITMPDFSKTQVNISRNAYDIRKVIFQISREDDFLLACIRISAHVADHIRRRKPHDRLRLFLFIQKTGFRMNASDIAAPLQILEMFQQPLCLVIHHRFPAKWLRPRRCS